MEQVMLAKGASPEEAIRLVQEKKAENEPKPGVTYSIRHGDEDDKGNADDGDGENDDDDNDEEFMAKYRQERLAELKKEQSINCRLDHISRSQWSEKVNEASKRCWVLVTMTDAPNQSKIQQELHQVARQQSGFNLLTIDYTQAIPNWPPERVPTIFAYRNGIKQHEWIAPANGIFPTPTQLQELLLEWDVILD